MQLNDMIMQAGADRFGFDLTDVKRLGGGGAPDGFVFANPRDPVVIKFLPINDDHLPIMRAKMDFVNYLRAGGVPTPAYLPSENGNMCIGQDDDRQIIIPITLITSTKCAWQTHWAIDLE